ncbi:methylenetetrahydrofolate reductase [Rhizobium lemnae]|uniref:Methylenetetrahydrofolate reductase n=1 Tax=Rhizobium lemnae TaxID=1214924 RepID=A0ABV8E4L6_9HYPH|nr:methylenetetrahydrofolate reductase [Rhizobium lemnae]
METARRLRNEGFSVTPHLPARSFTGRQELKDLLHQYRNEADVTHALLLAGGAQSTRGDLLSSFDLIDTGLFDKLGYRQLHVAGHPEGSRDIDPDGSTQNVDAALLRKCEFAKRTDARVVITSQFLFEVQTLLDWASRIETLGIDLPIHIGLAGPAKLQTLIKYAIACGVGPSVKVLQKRALSLSRLLLPYEPTEMAQKLEAYKFANPSSRIERFHMFPLGGIEPTVQWCRQQMKAQ